MYNQSIPELSQNTAAEHDTISANRFDNLCEYNEREGRGLSLEELNMEDNKQSSRPSRQNLGITEEGNIAAAAPENSVLEEQLTMRICDSETPIMLPQREE